MHYFLVSRFRSPFLVLFGEEEIANQVLGRFRFAKIDNRIQLHPQRLVWRNRQSPVDDFPGTFWCVSSLFWMSVLVRRGARGSSPLQPAFSVARLFPRQLEKFITWSDLIDQAQLPSFLCRIKFPLCNYFRRFLDANQPRQTSTTAPGGNKAQRRLGKSDPRRRIIRSNPIVARQCHFVAATSGCAVNCGDSRNFQFCQSIQNTLPVSNESPHVAVFGLLEHGLTLRRCPQAGC